MKKKFQIISLTAVIALTMTFAGQSFADNESHMMIYTKPFTDINNVIEKDKIISFQEKGYIHGVTKDLFIPNSSITIAQSVQLIVNTLGLNLDLVKFIKEPKATDYYKNAKNDAWYANALIIASVNGMKLSQGLDPNESWSREEFTHQLIQTIEAHTILPVNKFMPININDQENLNSDYQGTIQRAIIYGVIKLDAQGNFHPKDKISRAEAVAQAYNALEYIKAHPAPSPQPEVNPNNK